MNYRGRRVASAALHQYNLAREALDRQPSFKTQLLLLGLITLLAGAVGLYLQFPTSSSPHSTPAAQVIEKKGGVP